MPWPQDEPVEELQARFLAEFVQSDNRADICRRYGISRKTGYKIVARYHSLGITGLAPRSSAPHSHPGAVDDVVVEYVLAFRDSAPNASWAADKILGLWTRMDIEIKKPSRATITRILKDYRRTRRRRIHLTSTRTRCPPPAQFPNDVWAFDGKGTWRGIDPLSGEDLFSRFLLDLVNVPLTTQAVRRRCERLFGAHGIPRRIRTDGGHPFAGTGVGRLSSLSLWWLKLGIDAEVISKPQHNGNLERFHLTLEQEGARDGDVNSALEACRDLYNNVRPHQALGGRTPVEIYCPMPLTPLMRPSPIVDDARQVTGDGTFRWGGRRLFLSTVLARETVTFRLLEPELWFVQYRHLPLALFDERRFVLRRSPF